VTEEEAAAAEEEVAAAPEEEEEEAAAEVAEARCSTNASASSAKSRASPLVP